MPATFSSVGSSLEDGGLILCASDQIFPYCWAHKGWRAIVGLEASLICCLLHSQLTTGIETRTKKPDSQHFVRSEEAIHVGDIWYCDAVLFSWLQPLRFDFKSCWIAFTIGMYVLMNALKQRILFFYKDVSLQWLDKYNSTYSCVSSLDFLKQFNLTHSASKACQYVHILHVSPIEPSNQQKPSSPRVKDKWTSGSDP